MKKYPFVRQIGIKDCGVACLKMILQYYGGDYPIEKLRQLTCTTKEGTNAYNLIEGAKKIGLDAAGYEVKLEKLTNEQLPVIAYTVIDKVYQHYMVIYEFTKKGIIVGDPATKLRVIKYDEFASIFQNVVLIFSPLQILPKYQEEHFLKDKIKSLLNKYKKQFILLFLLTILITLFSIILTLPIKLLVDFLNYPISDFIFIIIICFFLFLLKFILEQIKNKFLIKISYEINQQLCLSILEKLLFLPYQYYRNHTTGEILSKIQDFEKVSSFLTITFSNIMIDVLMIISLFIVMYFIKPSLFLLLFIVTVIISFTSYLFQKKKLQLINQYITNKANFNSSLVEVISGFETVKGLNIEQEILENSNHKYSSLLNTQKCLEKRQLLENNIQNIIYYIGIMALLVAGFLEVKRGLSLGNFVLFYSLYAAVFQPIFNIIEWFYEWRGVKLSIQNIEDLIVEKQEFIKKYEEELKISYQNLQINIKEGNKIMLLGKSGIGKSTLLKMIKGYYENNFSYPHITSKEIIYLSQNEILFTDTILNNLLVGNHNESELSKVIKLCELEPIIKKQKLGLQALIEENGYNLSGGEKQRIILARALLQSPKILLVDEGFSQMNLELERIVLRNIIDYYQDMTMIVVSHRIENKDLFHQTYTLEGSE